MMKKTHYNILMVNLPFSGHTNPTLGLAQILVQLGHNVTYINAPDWQSKIERTGAHFVPYDHYPDSLSERQKKVKSWSAAYQTVLRMGKDYDCLIYEMLFFPGKALADRLNIPAYRLFSTFSLNEKILTEFGKTGGFYLTSIFRFTFLRHLLSRKLQRTFQLAYDDLAKSVLILPNSISRIQYGNFKLMLIRLMKITINTLGLPSIVLSSRLLISHLLKIRLFIFH